MKIDVYLPDIVGRGYGTYWRFKGRYRVCKGSRASKKSKTTALWYIYNLMKYPGANLLVVRKVFRTLKDSCFTELKWAIRRLGVEAGWVIKESPLEMTYIPTGQKIYFRGLDDPMKVTSITVASGSLCWLWMEEAYELTDEDDFNMLDESIRGETPPGLFKQLTLTLNPWNERHFIKSRFFDLNNDEEIVEKFSQGIIKRFVDAGGVPVDTLAMTTNYTMNEWLDAQDKAQFERMRKQNPRRYRVAGLGDWGSSGDSVFNENNIAAQLAKKVEPVSIMRFDPDSNIWCPDRKGWLKIYKTPVSGRPYVIGADTAGYGSDWFAAQVLDNITGEQVAVLHRRTIAEYEFVSQLIALGMMYNNALIAPEANFSTYVPNVLHERGYTKLYIREREDTYTGKHQQSFGFLTTAKNRERIISELIRIMDEEPELIVDADTLDEMQTFVRNEKGRAEAESGTFDDLVLAAAISHEARAQQRKYVAELEKTIIPAVDKTSWNKAMRQRWQSTPDEYKQGLLDYWRGEGTI